LQALVRVDPGGFAARELSERAAARFPPAVTLITIEGPHEALQEFASLIKPATPVEMLGPVDLDAMGPPPEDPAAVSQRLMLRAPLAAGLSLVRAAKEAAAIRSARKSSGPLRIRVNPATLN
jgi:primosomal protein N' (replication factor Y)